MVPPGINRKRGKTREANRRALGRMKKKNRQVAGKVAAPVLADRGKVQIGKKKMKKKEQRAKLLADGKEVGEQMAD